ncbi:MAG: M23 family metallopeptidase [archaeon]
MTRHKNSRMRNNRKAQLYPVAITLFTMAVLSIAFVNIMASKEMKGKKIGEYQAEVFASLQDSDSINLYLEKSAELAAQFALNDIEKSCMVNINMEHTVDPLESECGKYIYPLWSTSVSICLPDCKQAFKQSFQEYLLTGIDSYRKVTSILLPVSYDIQLDAGEKQFTIKGIASNDENLNVLSLDQRKDYPVNVQPDFTGIVSDQQAISAPKPPVDTTSSVGTYYGLLDWPVDDSKWSQKHYLVSCFGERPASGSNSIEHGGIDISVPLGTPVLAAYDGEVTQAGGKVVPGQKNKQITTGDSTLNYDCWGAVVIRHGDYLSTEYMHLDTIDASIVPGAKVKKGQVIGTAGTRGTWKSKTKNVKCDVGAFGAHLHFEVLYDKVTTEKYTENKISQNLFVKGKRVQTFCFLKIGDYTKKPAAQNNPECFTPINLEGNLDEVCGMYDFDFSPPATAPKQALKAPASPTSNKATGSIIAAMTGQATTDASASAKDKTADSVSVFNPFGTYSFKPSFSVKVNKDLNDPIAPITAWFEKTWQECEDKVTGCVEEKMTAFNSVEGRKFDLSFADRCEANPDFYNMMEFTEDCLSNGAYKCGCEFDTTKIQSSKNMKISFDFTENKATLYLEKDGKFEEAESYQLYFGSLESAAGKYERMDYLLNFKDDGSLDTARLMAYSKNEDGSYSLDSSASLTNYLKLRIAKPEKADAGVLFNDPNLLSCVYKKNKFRLCAKPLAPELSILKFAMTIKDKPPAALGKDAVSVTTVAPCSETEIQKILTVKGIDLMKIASMVPIPGVNVIGIADVMNNLPESKPSSLQVAVNNPDSDIAGYEVYCNDILTDMLPADVLNKYNPNNFVTVANNQIGGKTSQLDSYVKSNSYASFLDGTDCGVPVTRPNGETIKVPAVKGLTKDGKTVFSIEKCGNVPVIMSKMLPNNYCVSIVPVDKNGNKMNQYAYTNCAQTNSLLNLALKDLLDKQLGGFLVIPESFLPKELKPQAEQPCPGKIDAIASGKGLDLMKLANFGSVDYIKSYLQTAATGMVTSEVTSTALVNSVNGMNSMWAKQAVFTALSGEIKNEDSKLLFDSAISGSMSNAARSFVLQKGTKYISDEKAKEIVGKAAAGEGADSIANSELREALAKDLTADQKRQDILSTANDARGGDLEQKIINKALEKRCGDYDIDVETAMDCLDDNDVEEAYDESLMEFNAVEQGGSAALIERGMDRMGPTKTRDILGNVVSQNYRGLASDMVQAELAKMPESSKREFIQDALQGRIPDANVIQSELLKMATTNNNDYVTKILQNGNIRDLLQDTLKTELEKQLKSFIKSECKPKSVPLQ